jgi:Transposase DDE domain group 1
MSIPSTWPQYLEFFGMPFVIEPSPGQLSGDAGLLPIRQFDQRVGLTRAFADALDDPRDPDLTEHTFLEIVSARVYGILAGYEDRNDHDAHRADLTCFVADHSGVNSSDREFRVNCPPARTIRERTPRPAG